MEAETSREQQQTSAHPVSHGVKAAVFTGIFLLRTLSGIPWIWGNLTAYVTSYYYAKGDTWSGDSTNWIISAEMLTFNFAVLIGNSVTMKIGLRTTLVLALLLFNSAILLTYITVKHSVVAFCLTFGGLSGFSGGIVEVIQLILIVRWTEKYQGLSTSSVQSALILGAVVLNLFLTCFINTNNEEPDAIVDRKAVFTQRDIIERVPSVFLVYGMISTVLNFVGFFLVRGRPGEKDFFTETRTRFSKCNRLTGEKVTLLKSEEKVVVTGFTVATPTTGSTSRLHNDLSHTNSDVPSSRHFESSRQSDVKSLRHHGTNIICDNDDDLSNRNSDNDIPCDDDNDALPIISDTSDTSNITASDLTPRQVLNKRSFYSLLVFKAMQFYAFFIFNTYYKTFGLLYIPDDHFLTAIVMVKCFVTPICTWVAGFTLDKFGVKPTLVVVSSIFCILSSLFYLTPFDKWMYFFSCVLCGSALFSLFCVTGACCVKLYGETHFTTIYGMTFIPGYVMIPLLPPLTAWIISVFGWFALFISVAVFALINVLTLIWGLPEKAD